MNDKRIYLDNAATTWPKARDLFAAMIDQYLEIGVSPGRGSYDQAVTAETYVHQTRKKVAKLFHAPDPDRVIFTANATDGLNLALFGILRPGDHVVTTRLEHNSVLRPLFHLQQTRGVTLTLVPFDGHGYIDPREISRAIGTRTTLVVVNHASNVLGTVQPIASIGKICQACGVPLLVDSSQSAGHIPVSMEEMTASAIVFTGHKALYGPTGIGGLILHPDLTIQSSRFGGTGMESRSMVHTQTFPHRLEAGTLNLMGIIGLSLAIDTGAEDFQEAHLQRELELTRKLYEGLQDIPGVILYGGPVSAGHVPLFSANIDGMHPEDLAAILDGDFNIAVRAGLHCAPLVHETLGTVEQGAVRFSLGRYNTIEDIETVVEAMSRIAAHRQKGLQG